MQKTVIENLPAQVQQGNKTNLREAGKLNTSSSRFSEIIQTKTYFLKKLRQKINSETFPKKPTKFFSRRSRGNCKEQLKTLEKCDFHIDVCSWSAKSTKNSTALGEDSRSLLKDCLTRTNIEEIVQRSSKFVFILPKTIIDKD